MCRIFLWGFMCFFVFLYFCFFFLPYGWNKVIIIEVIIMSMSCLSQPHSRSFHISSDQTEPSFETFRRASSPQRTENCPFSSCCLIPFELCLIPFSTPVSPLVSATQPNQTKNTKPHIKTFWSSITKTIQSKLAIQDNKHQLPCHRFKFSFNDKNCHNSRKINLLF